MRWRRNSTCPHKERKVNTERAAVEKKKKGAAACRMTWPCLPGRWGDGVKRRAGVEEEEKNEGKGVRDGRMKSQRGERGLTIILGSTDKDGGQMLSPVFSGWAAQVSTPNIGK